MSLISRNLVPRLEWFLFSSSFFDNRTYDTAKSLLEIHNVITIGCNDLRFLSEPLESLMERSLLDIPNVIIIGCNDLGFHSTPLESIDLWISVN
jgi:hypothetical protein